MFLTYAYFKLEKYLALVKKYEYRKSICKLRTSAHRLFIETGRYTNIPEMKEYVKIVQIKKLKMKLTFSLDVQNLVGREMIFSIPYQLKVKKITYLSDKNKLFWLLNCENQEILNSVGRFLYQSMS